MAKTSRLTVQKWGNSLAVRIPSAIARSAGFKAGQAVQVSARNDGVLVKISGEVRLTLAQKLAQFDPEQHGGEAMPAKRIGNEVF